MGRAHDPGDRITLTRSFTIGQAVSSVEITCTLRAPGVVDDDELVVVDIEPTYEGNTAIGVGTFDIPASNASNGRWAVRWTIDNDIIGSHEEFFFVGYSRTLPA